MGVVFQRSPIMWQFEDGNTWYEGTNASPFTGAKYLKHEKSKARWKENV